MGRFNRGAVLKILDRARSIDKKLELFGAAAHKYTLNPTVDIAAVRAAEKRLKIELPEEYVRFITETGNGGAGPDYGILTLEESLRQSGAEEGFETALSRPFEIRPMAADEADDYAFDGEAYARNPERFFVSGNFDYENGFADGYFVLGTHGSQWDFGFAATGERKGQVFDTDNEGAFAFVADGFDGFYGDWLDKIADAAYIENRLKLHRERLERIKKLKK